MVLESKKKEYIADHRKNIKYQPGNISQKQSGYRERDNSFEGIVDIRNFNLPDQILTQFDVFVP